MTVPSPDGSVIAVMAQPSLAAVFARIVAVTVSLWLPGAESSVETDLGAGAMATRAEARGDLGVLIERYRLSVLHDRWLFTLVTSWAGVTTWRAIVEIVHDGSPLLVELAVAGITASLPAIIAAPRIYRDLRTFPLKLFERGFVLREWRRIYVVPFAEIRRVRIERRAGLFGRWARIPVAVVTLADGSAVRFDLVVHRYGAAMDDIRARCPHLEGVR